MKQKKQSKKKYLEHKISAATFLIWIILGFTGGSIIGTLIFQDNNSDSITLSVVYSSEKSTWMSEASVLFAKYWEERRANDPSLHPINLDFLPYGSGDSLISLLNGEIKPVIWSPASNIWVPLLNAKWSQSSGNSHLIAPNYTRIIYSPIVLATWENFYQEHPFNGLNDLHDLIQNNPNLIKMAHTDPRSSNSGFMATIMMVSSYLKMNSSQISLNNLTQPNIQQWMKELESSAIFYGKSTGFLGRYMRDQGPEALQVAILYENLIQDFSQTAEEKYGQKMIAVYPEEGAMFSDHPFCILDADWVSPEQKYIAQEFLKFLQSDDLVIKAIQSGFRPINSSYLDNPAIAAVYDESFNMDYGVSNDISIITELKAPDDGNVIARIPDLWLLTRNTV
ncbi:MAG: extracellular solute-binding protein [Promethearchaeota archaeon]